MIAPALPPPPGFAERLSGRPLLLLLDVDGTLAPIAQRPHEAAIPDEMLAVLRAAAADPQMRVVFVSGRSAADARRLAPVPGSWVVGNHGFETLEPTGEERPDPRLETFVPALREAVALARTLATPGVIVEDKRWTLSVHFRLADPAAVPALAAGLGVIAEQLGLRTTGGKQVIELRPPLDVHKGTAAVQLARRLLPGGTGGVFCAGDDRTDEDMFRSVRETWPSAVTVRVATEPAETAAEFFVDGTAELRELLGLVLGL